MLPGVGPRSAERMALWLATAEKARPGQLAAALGEIEGTLRRCTLCGFFTLDPLCQICADPTRAGQEICVVERITDILPLERTGAFHGRYHALGGRLSPLEQIGPDDLRISDLSRRIEEEQPTELILALSGDVEGEATANYLAELYRGRGLRISRLAQGIPAGMGLEYSDELTLTRAIRGRLRLSADPSPEDP